MSKFAWVLCFTKKRKSDFSHITSWILGAVRIDAPLIGDCDGKKVQVQVLGAGEIIKKS